MAASAPRPSAKLLNAEQLKQDDQLRELAKLTEECERRNAEELEPRLRRAKQLQDRLSRKAELMLQLGMASLEWNERVALPLVPLTNTSGPSTFVVATWQ